MKPLVTILALLALALAGAAGMNPWPPLLLAAVALAVRAVEGVRALYGISCVSVPIPVRGSAKRPVAIASLPTRSPETVVATIYERSGRLVLRRRRG